jgi:hypothetical protein
MNPGCSYGYKSCFLEALREKKEQRGLTPADLDWKKSLHLIEEAATAVRAEEEVEEDVGDEDEVDVLMFAGMSVQRWKWLRKFMVFESKLMQNMCIRAM